MRTHPRWAGLTGRPRAALAALAISCVLAGCATVPPPDDAMNRTQMQLDIARDAGAADYAPVDYGFAQDKFQQALQAMSAHKYADAAALAEESRADAELAQAKARLAEARAKIQDKLSENNHLRSESERLEKIASGQAAPPAAAPTTIEDMPAPASSALGAPVDDDFQTLPAGATHGDDGQDDEGGQ